CVYSQKTNSTKKALPKKHTSFFRLFLKPIMHNGADPSMQQGVLISRNESSFLPYEGKGIRHILVKEFGLEKNFADTSTDTNYFGRDFIKRLHRNTKEWVIRNNLFVKEKTALNANLVADNERHLRSLDYI